MTTPLEQKFNPLSGFNLVPKDMSAITKESSGFDDPTLVTSNSYDSGTQKITLAGTFKAYYQNADITAVVNAYDTGHADETGKVWFLFYDGTNVIWQDSPWTFDKVQIAAVYYGATHKFGLKEHHSLMDYLAHRADHQAIGTYRTAGSITAASYVLNSVTAADRRPLVDAVTMYDEDLPTTNAALLSEIYTQMYISGAQASPATEWVVDAADIVPLSGAQPYYNQNNAGTWQQTLLPNNAYMALFLIAIPTTDDATSQKYRYCWVQGQTQSTTLSTIQAVTPANMDLGDFGRLAPEFVYVAKIIIRYTAANWVLISVETISGNRISQSLTTGGGLSTVATDETISGNGTASSPLSTVPEVSATATYNSVKLPNTAYLSVANLFSSTLTFDSDGVMLFTIAVGGLNMLCMANYNLATISVLADAGNLFLATDAGTGVYVGKSATSYDVIVKNRMGSAQNMIVQSINSNITSATTWA